MSESSAALVTQSESVSGVRRYPGNRLSESGARSHWEVRMTNDSVARARPESGSSLASSESLPGNILWQARYFIGDFNAGFAKAM